LSDLKTQISVLLSFFLCQESLPFKNCEQLVA